MCKTWNLKVQWIWSQVYHFRFHTKSCVLNTNRNQTSTVSLKKKLGKSANEKSFHLFLYGTHHLGINLLPLFKSLFTIHDSISFLFSFFAFSFSNFFDDNNRNIILILCHSKKNRTKPCIFGTMLFYSDMKISLVTLFLSFASQTYKKKIYIWGYHIKLKW